MIPTAVLRRAAVPIGAFVLCMVATTVALAQAEAFPVTGRLTDADQVAIPGYRVVFREMGSGQVYLSPPTDEEGAYRLEVPTGVNLEPVAVIAPDGTRVPLEGLAPQVAMPGARFDIELPVRIVDIDQERPFPGADRLFRSFVEDVVFVDRLRAQAQVSAADFENATSYVSEALVAFNVMALPRFEMGGRAGFAGTEFDDDGGATGVTDVDLWAKFLMFSSPMSRLRAAAGAIVSLPTGEPETGRATGALGTKVFAAARYGIGTVTLSANGGARFTADTDIDGVDRTGQVSGSFGAAALVPFGERICGVVEAGYETARFEDGEDEGQALLGVNWTVFREGILRVAVGFGLGDASPDTEIVAGYAFEF